MSEFIAPTGISGAPLGKVRNPWGAWGLSLVTCGIYYVYWWYKVNEEAAAYDRSIEVNPTMSALALFVPICNIVSIVRTGDRIKSAQTNGGVLARCSGWLGLLLAILFSLHIVYYQTALNDLWGGGTEG